jgi:exopolysaccharide production protein ExoQ
MPSFMASSGRTMTSVTDNQIVLQRATRGFAPWIVEAAFIALLLLIFVSLQPFAERNTVDTAVGASAAEAAGSTLRQLFYLVTFAIILVGALMKRGINAANAVPVVFAVLLAWCAMTALWATEPSVSLRRAILEIVVVLSVLLGADAVGPERSLKLFSYVLILVLVVNWISIPLVSQAIHQPGDIEPDVAGDWRGLYFHKNIAGAVCAISVMVFLYYAIAEKKWLLYGTLATAAFGFLLMTRSKSSLGLLPIAVAAAGIYRLAWRRDIDRTIVAITAVLLTIGLAVLFFANYDLIARLLADPEQFTGRAAIWQGEIAFIRDHPLTGSGFGTFADTGTTSPIHDYVGGWVSAVAQGHNGYLELGVTTGLIGFALAMIAFVVIPARAFWTRSDMEPWLNSLLFALFVFFVLHNFMESDFLASDGVVWTTFLIMLAALRGARA